MIYKAVVLFCIAILLWSCSPQKKESIVGTWTDIQGNKWTFGEDQRLTYDYGSNSVSWPYNVVDSKLYIDAQRYDISFSPDGETVILTGGSDLGVVEGRYESIAGLNAHYNRLSKAPNYYIVDKPVKTYTVEGSWTDVENLSWVFDENLVLTYENGKKGFRKYTYAVNGSKLIVRGSLNFRNDDSQQTYDMSFSEDGKILILTGGVDFRTWNTGGPGWHDNRLIRQTTE